MSKTDFAAREAFDNASRPTVAVAGPERQQPYLVDLASPQALHDARALREAARPGSVHGLHLPAVFADAGVHLKQQSAHHEGQIPRLELPPLNAAQLKELAARREHPPTVADWNSKHAALVQKAKHTDARLQFFGDSITEFIGNDNLGAFNKNFASLKPDNFGIAGDTTTGLLKRVNDGELGGHPKAVVLLIGTNDVALGKNPDDIAQDIAKVVKTVRLKEPDAKVLIMGLLPRCAPDDPHRGEMLQKIARVNSEIRQLDNGQAVRYIDIGRSFADAKGQARRDLLPDYLHPNNAGYQVWSNAIKPIIDKMTR